MLPWIIGGAVALLLIILIAYIPSSYNKLVAFSVRVDNGWSQVDVQLKKRYDLIPNLVETVKGYASHEKSTLENVVKWRNTAVSASTPADAMKANGELTGALSRLLVTVEQYPDLKANQSFLSLQGELSDIENKIAMSRQFYNDTVMKYNEYLLKFPSNIIAGMFHFEKRPYFEVEEEAKAAPKVSF